MTKRARRVCETLAKKSVVKKKQKGKRKEESVMLNITNIPEMELTPAPEVRQYGITKGVYRDALGNT